MSIFQDVGGQIVEAMREKNTVRLNALRGMKATFMTEMISLKKTSSEILSDDEAHAVIKRMVKQRKDSVEQFLKGGRKDLAKEEEAELKILEIFLPAQMSEKDVRKIAEATMKKLGVTDLPAQAGKTKLGQLIGAVMKETKGKADGGMVKTVVESLFK
ncbi:MAG: GatB/YqeY domain-containing protein [bacterium]|nr:GatB/YqeY domain-containing protein [bacterium]